MKKEPFKIDGATVGLHPPELLQACMKCVTHDTGRYSSSCGSNITFTLSETYVSSRIDNPHRLEHGQDEDKDKHSDLPLQVPALPCASAVRARLHRLFYAACLWFCVLSAYCTDFWVSPVLGACRPMLLLGAVCVLVWVCEVYSVGCCTFWVRVVRAIPVLPAVCLLFWVCRLHPIQCLSLSLSLSVSDYLCLTTSPSPGLRFCNTHVLPRRCGKLLTRTSDVTTRITQCTKKLY